MYVKSASAIVVAIVVGASLCQAKSSGEWEEKYFRLEWQLEEGKRGPALTGYIYNEFGMLATSVQLVVEQLDDSGAVVSTSIGYVDGGVRPNGRKYFWVPVSSARASYRMRIHSYDFRRR